MLRSLGCSHYHVSEGPQQRKPSFYLMVLQLCLEVNGRPRQKAREFRL